jgi:hypothetical protein
VPVVKNVPSRRCEPAGGVVVVDAVPVPGVRIPLPLPFPPPLPPRAIANSGNDIAQITANPNTIICLIFIIYFFLIDYNYTRGTQVEVGVRVLVRVCDFVAAIASPAIVIAKIATRARAISRFVFMFIFSL